MCDHLAHGDISISSVWFMCELIDWYVKREIWALMCAPPPGYVEHHNLQRKRSKIKITMNTHFIDRISADLFQFSAAPLRILRRAKKTSRVFFYEFRGRVVFLRNAPSRGDCMGGWTTKGPSIDLGVLSTRPYPLALGLSFREWYINYELAINSKFRRGQIARGPCGNRLKFDPRSKGSMAKMQWHFGLTHTGFRASWKWTTVFGEFWFVEFFGGAYKSLSICSSETDTSRDWWPMWAESCEVDLAGWKDFLSILVYLKNIFPLKHCRALLACDWM